MEAMTREIKVKLEKSGEYIRLVIENELIATFISNGTFKFFGQDSAPARFTGRWREEGETGEFKIKLEDIGGSICLLINNNNQAYVHRDGVFSFYGPTSTSRLYVGRWKL